MTYKIMVNVEYRLLTSNHHRNYYQLLYRISINLIYLKKEFITINYFQMLLIFTYSILHFQYKK